MSNCECKNINKQINPMSSSIDQIDTMKNQLKQYFRTQKFCEHELSVWIANDDDQ